MQHLSGVAGEKEAGRLKRVGHFAAAVADISVHGNRHHFQAHVISFVNKWKLPPGRRPFLGEREGVRSLRGPDMEMPEIRGMAN